MLRVKAGGLGSMAWISCMLKGLGRSAVNFCELWTSVGPRLDAVSAHLLRVVFPMIEKSQGMPWGH